MHSVPHRQGDLGVDLVEFDRQLAVRAVRNPRGSPGGGPACERDRRPLRVDAQGVRRRPRRGLPAPLHQHPDALRRAGRPTRRPTATRRGSTSARSRCRRPGAAGGSCCTWAPPRASSSCTSTAPRSAPGKDSHLASEFDVTPYLTPGSTSTLRLVVVKWSDASYIEDQDEWWHGGDTRSASCTRPRPCTSRNVHAVADVVVPGAAAGRRPRCAPSPRRRDGERAAAGRRPRGCARHRGPGRLDRPGGAELAGAPSAGGDAALDQAAAGSVPASAAVDTPEARAARGVSGAHCGGGRALHPVPARRRRRAHAGRGGELGRALEQYRCPLGMGRLRLELDVPHVRPWTAELPHLYDLEVTLHGPDGAAVERGDVPGRLPTGRDQGQGAADQRRARAAAWRQPPRLRPGDRSSRRRGFDACRHRAHEADGRQRSAYLARTERPCVLRPLRRTRPVRDRRGEHRESRVHLLAVRRSAVQRPMARAGPAHGRTRCPPSEHHHVVTRQRIGLRRESRRAAGWIRGYDPSRPLHYEGATLRDRAGGARSPTSCRRCTPRSTTSCSGPRRRPAR